MELLAEHGNGIFVTFSSQLAPILGEYERTATTALNAYVGPKMDSYLEALDFQLRANGLAQPVLVMQGNGGLTSVADAAQRPIMTLDSGPTGGVLGCFYLGHLYDEPNVICTDVGGTSFDVGLILDHELSLEPVPVVSQYNVRVPKVSVKSIGAGGGSVAWVDALGLLRVGPQSAGSTPGPACYGLGGVEPTVTDADLVLGYLDPAAFLGGRMPLDKDLAMRALDNLGSRIGLEAEEVAVGIFRIINSHMADLIRTSTIERGHDPRDCIVVAYGGAAPTHAAFYGSDIDAKGIYVLADSTAFSAEGMLSCDVVHTAEMSDLLVSPLGEAGHSRMSKQFELLEQLVLAQFARESVPAANVEIERRLGTRYCLQVHTIDVPLDQGAVTSDSIDAATARFVERYRQLYGSGSVLTDGALEFEIHRVTGRLPIEPIAMPSYPNGSSSQPAPKAERPAHFEPLGFVPTAIFDGSELRSGQTIAGPAIVQRMGDSVVVPPGFSATVDMYLTLRIARAGSPSTRGGNVP
jgi:N-methylhydantoinase A